MNITSVRLTPAEIRSGQPCSAGDCPIAINLLQQIAPGCYRELDDGRLSYITGSALHIGVEVDTDSIRVDLADGSTWWAYPPDGMNDFITTFDELKEFDSRDELAAAAEAGLLQWDIKWELGPGGGDD